MQIQTNDKLYMITDYCSGGELFFHLKRMRRFEAFKITCISRSYSLSYSVLLVIIHITHFSLTATHWTNITHTSRFTNFDFYFKKLFFRFTEGMMRFYSAQIALALNHLHERSILFRDLKPENVIAYFHELTSSLITH